MMCTIGIVYQTYTFFVILSDSELSNVQYARRSYRVAIDASLSLSMTIKNALVFTVGV
ncbi:MULTISPECIES: hypothetical protein [unclassified Mucilaginibacter]|uniref:hypothetical protein n=1 Tax=unclassified Mucilaginibacter TaxID=2617802 RepID=UPI002AC8B935|nr:MULTISPECIES: hypothetical protein [unclassified Mucilaginibacter]MEB0299808.1 hypothetical protein [Mucilaginibacter sp. 5C4]WPX22009.1 hypothetical protein RHM67_12035 [Mucilaginibacter sp. 5C4]